MYAYIKGIITEISDSSITVEAGGIGYEVYVSAYSASFFTIGKECTVFTYLAVSDDGATLFGFSSKEEKSLFIKLINVNGIGPKGAITILGGMSAKDLISYIISGNSAAISSIKGIGKKTAERIIIELKDKFNDTGVMPVQPILQLDGVAGEAVEVLVALGYKREVAEHSVKKAYEDGMTVNQTVHKAIGGK